MSAAAASAGTAHAGLVLRLSLTDRCQLRCRYCRPALRAAPAPIRRDALLGVDELVRFVGIAAKHFGVAKVRLTGGEPLLRPDIIAVVRGIAALGTAEVAMTTNGQRLAAHAPALREAGLARLNVSLDALAGDTFSAVTAGGTLQATLDGLAAARTEGFAPIKLNTVLLRDLNLSEAPALVSFALAHGFEGRFIELMPAGLAAADYARLHVSNDELAALLRTRFELEPLPIELGSSSRRFRVRDERGREGTLGFISPIGHPFCRGCRRLRLSADGDLLGCLGRKERFALMPYLRRADPEAEAHVVAAMRAALACKRPAGAFAPATAMSAIGG